MIEMDDDNPYAPPKSLEHEQDILVEHPNAAWRDGNMLMVRKGAVLPDRCLKCNAPAEGYQFTRTISWITPWWFLLLLIALLLFVLAYYVFRWQGKVTVGLCPRHRTNRVRAVVLGWLTTLVGAGLVPVSTMVPKLESIALVAGPLLVIFGVLGGMLGSRVLVAKRIDKNFIWLGSVSPDYLETFPDRITAIKNSAGLESVGVSSYPRQGKQPGAKGVGHGVGGFPAVARLFLHGLEQDPFQALRGVGPEGRKGHWGMLEDDLVRPRLARVESQVGVAVGQQVEQAWRPRSRCRRARARR